MPKTLLCRNLRRWSQIASSCPQSSNRRQFLRDSVSGLMLAQPFLHSLEGWAALSSPQTTASGASVAVVGAGVAGLTAALELTRLGHRATVFEASHRLGGRILTVENFNSDKMHVDMGGEFVDSEHEAIQKLCRELKVPIDAYAPGDKGLEPNLYYFGGRYYTDTDAIAALKPLTARLKADASQLKNPAQLAKYDRLSVDQYLRGFDDKTEPWFLNLLRVGMLAEAGLSADEIPAAYLLWMLDPSTEHGFRIYGDSDQGHCIRGGSITLIKALEQSLRQKDVEVRLNHELVAIGESQSKLKLSLKKDATTTEQVFDQVICALPFSVLREVHGLDRLGLRPQKLDLIRHGTYASFGKLVLSYRSKTWRRGDQLPDGTKIPRSNGMVYSDLVTQNTYECSRTLKGASGILTNFVGAEQGRKLNVAKQTEFAAANAKIFPALKGQADGNVMAWNWYEYRFSRGAYSTVKVGDITRFGKVAPFAELGGRLHFAGEHADEQFDGFMEGAVRSALRAAREVVQQVGSPASSKTTKRPV